MYNIVLENDTWKKVLEQKSFRAKKFPLPPTEFSPIPDIEPDQ